ncbi:hydrogenase maturation protease [Frankia sp. CNm7]|uniref:Hydrogenase maturation protease n=1 Tax=Frankia nepalensis TaxID=1836974 RepID=A0A937US77_9ACTN|nr:hydrogenase maturation protease [Frankia nepalensis]MBL7510386.1 hydrogenase maturation protease [Frankia nepalensis]MBL7520927.1 hydrogenase maturation protease [Frankia nepalensis]MBL7629985.1 hydrogenase maturation protease [Frankia nepalensis]
MTGAGPAPTRGPGTGGPRAPRVLVAGIGNVFLGDDGFGVQVVRRIARGPVPDGVDVVDYGIRGVHLAYDLLDGRYATVVMVDAAPLDGPPGTLGVLEVDTAAPPADTAAAGVGGTTPGFDAHGLHPEAVLALLRGLGGHIDRVLVVGCQPAALDEGMDLSEPVRASVDAAARLVLQLARNEVAALAGAEERRNAR